MRPVVVVGVAWLLAAPVPKEKAREFTCLDLQQEANWQLTEGEGNNLAALPKKQQIFGGVTFNIGDGLIQLGSSTLADKPEKVEGVKVGMTCRTIHFLHACHRSAKDDAIIGYYTINYEDKSQETVALVYGKDIADWWYTEGAAEPSRAKVAWNGENDVAKDQGSKIRLYLRTWRNPEPLRKVVSIDFGSTSYTGTSPFCVAITVEK